jgi:hypothetical protein
VREASTEQKQSEERRGTDKNEEVAVVAASNTIVEPHAVMILGFHTIVTHTTVMRTWGAPDVATFAILSRHFHSGISACGRNDHGPFRGRRTKTQGVLIRISWGKWM